MRELLLTEAKNGWIVKTTDPSRYTRGLQQSINRITETFPGEGEIGQKIAAFIKELDEVQTGFDESRVFGNIDDAFEHIKTIVAVWK